MTGSALFCFLHIRLAQAVAREASVPHHLGCFSQNNKINATEASSWYKRPPQARPMRVSLRFITHRGVLTDYRLSEASRWPRHVTTQQNEAFRSTRDGQACRGRHSSRGKRLYHAVCRWGVSYRCYLLRQCLGEKKGKKERKQGEQANCDGFHSTDFFFPQHLSVTQI